MTDREKLYAQKLSKMVQCNTVSEMDSENVEKFEQFHEVLAQLFPNVFRKCEVVKIGEALLLKLATTNSAEPKGEPIVLMSHQDVVPATGKWQHEPFSGDIDENGIIWGRGTMDTKCSLMCIFQAMEEIIEEGYEPKVDVYIASSCNEELSGYGAPKTVAYLQEKGVHLQLLIDEGGMIVTDPMAGVKGQFAMIGTLEKGHGNIKITARSNGGHASTPKKGSPIARLSGFVSEIEKHDPNKAKMNSTMQEMLRRFAPYTSGALGFVFKHIKVFSPLLEKVLPKINASAGAMIKTTMAFTMCGGSNAANVLPEEAWLNINTRFIQHQGIEETRKILQPLCEKYDLEMEFINPRAPQKPVDFTKEGYKLVEEVVKEIYPNVHPTPYVMTGGTDAYFYWPITDNAIRFAPLIITDQQLKSIHGLDENIAASSLPSGVDFYKTVIRRVK